MKTLTAYVMFFDNTDRMKYFLAGSGIQPGSGGKQNEIRFNII